MIYATIPARVILEHPSEYKMPEVPAMTWKGMQAAAENGCIRHALYANPFEFLNVGPGSRI